MLKAERIHYSVLADAIFFYESHNVKYIEVPWIIDQKYNEPTRPDEKDEFYINDSNDVFIASGETAFLKMVDDNKIEEDQMYMTATPCFRDEIPDEIHSTEFIKLELFKLHPENIMPYITLSKTFMEKFSPVYVTKTDIGYDIIREKDELELGSYGTRVWNGVEYFYGTGCALPRLTTNLSIGYHVTPFPKEKYGTIGKILEEINEVKDSVLQDNPIMILTELADLYGAIEKYIEIYNMDMDDLKSMSLVTKRAFESGRR